MIKSVLPYLLSFVVPLVVTLLLTPLVREFNRRLGMVDKPDARRINKTPIPRGGGLALYLGSCVTYLVMRLLAGDFCTIIGDVRYAKLFLLITIIVAIGYVDDKVSLKPIVKLIGQLVVAFLSWWWVGLGFDDILPEMPAWVDCLLTMLWITGAINAFNLIDGLDGLASGLALIATIGMAGSLFFLGKSSDIMFYCAFAGGLIGFLCYNFNPASVFLGDSGSMMIGYLLATLPLCSHVPNSFLVSVVVPLLAMGVPVFDTALAIVRRSIRRMTAHGGGEVMQADVDHLHHRLLRAMGMNQRKTAVVIYLVSVGLVAFALGAAYLKCRSGVVWLVALALFAAIFFKEMCRIEMFDLGQFMGGMMHSEKITSRRLVARLSVPFYLCCDVLVLFGSFLLACWLLRIPMTMRLMKTMMPTMVASTFGCLVFFKAYWTVWPRAVLSNYVRLLAACGLGAIIGSIAVWCFPSIPMNYGKPMAVAYMMISFLGVLLVRSIRPIARDSFYALDCRRMVSRKDVTRILVYGCGLRYKALRRELVRSASKNRRVIVGLLDDDMLLCGHYIGGIKVEGSLLEVKEIVNRLNIDEVVIACVMTPTRLMVIKDALTSLGVKISVFSFDESKMENIVDKEMNS